MKKIQAVQTRDYIADAIRNEILAGNMRPGEELTQETLAEMLGVSRMPVREALQLLEQEGFIERLPNRHMAVARLEEHKLEEIMEMAAAMEAEIAIQLSRRPDGDAAKALDAMGHALQNGQTEEASAQELGYHSNLAMMLENPYIEQLFEKVLGGYVEYLIRWPGRDREQSYRQLCQVQAAMKDGERERIRECLQQYYRELLASWNRKGPL